MVQTQSGKSFFTPRGDVKSLQYHNQQCISPNQTQYTQAQNPQPCEPVLVQWEMKESSLLNYFLLKHRKQSNQKDPHDQKKRSPWTPTATNSTTMTTMTTMTAMTLMTTMTTVTTETAIQIQIESDLVKNDFGNFSDYKNYNDYRDSDLD